MLGLLHGLALAFSTLSEQLLYRQHCPDCREDLAFTHNVNTRLIGSYIGSYYLLYRLGLLIKQWHVIHASHVSAISCAPYNSAASHRRLPNKPQGVVLPRFHHVGNVEASGGKANKVCRLMLKQVRRLIASSQAARQHASSMGATFQKPHPCHREMA